MYEFGRVKEAQHELDQAKGDHARQQQYFENNPKLKEALETRLKKADRNVNSALLEYAKVARDTEPMLREFASERGGERIPDEESIRRIVRAEVRDEIRERRHRDDFVSHRSLDSKLTEFDRKQQNRLSADIRAAIHKETAAFARKDDVEILSDKVKGMNTREQRTSVTSDIRETDQRIVAHAREIESLKAELTARTNRQNQEFSSLKDLVDDIQKDSAAQQTSRIQIRGAQTDDIVKVCLKFYKSDAIGGISAGKSPRSHQRSVYHYSRSSIPSHLCPRRYTHPEWSCRGIRQTFRCRPRIDAGILFRSPSRKQQSQ